jgi:hypothetical protein
MPEPTSTAVAAATLAAVSASIPAITIFGVTTGLRTDVLLAGLLGSFVGMILLNTMPGDIDTWRNLLLTTLRRMLFALASAVTAGYLMPIVLWAVKVPDSLMLGVACVVGVYAQRFLIFVRRRLSPPTRADAANTEGAKL